MKLGCQCATVRYGDSPENHASKSRHGLQSSGAIGPKQAQCEEEESQLAKAKLESLVPQIHSHAESLSFKYWKTGRLGVEDRLSDCFYVIHGTYQKELQSPHEFSDITTLRTLPAGEQDDLREVCIFDNDKDDGLLVVQEAAAEAMASAVYDGPEACIRALASVVSDHMGGAAATTEQQEELLRKWARSSAAIKQERQSPIVLTAQLEAAGPAHRALLFKFLADASNVPCTLIGRRCKNGGDAEATALVRIGGRLMAVDLVANPGQLHRWMRDDIKPALRASSTDEQLKDLIAEGAPTLKQISPTDSFDWRRDLETIPIRAASETEAPYRLSSDSSTEEMPGVSAPSHRLKNSSSAPKVDQSKQQVHISVEELKAAARSGSHRFMPSQEDSPLGHPVADSPPPSKRYSGDSRRALAAAARGSARACGSNAVTSSFTSPGSALSFTGSYRSTSASPGSGTSQHPELSFNSFSARAEAAALAKQSLRAPLMREDPSSFSFPDGLKKSSRLSLPGSKGNQLQRQPGALQQSIIKSLSQTLPGQMLQDKSRPATHMQSQRPDSHLISSRATVAASRSERNAHQEFPLKSLPAATLPTQPSNVKSGVSDTSWEPASVTCPENPEPSFSVLPETPKMLIRPCLQSSAVDAFGGPSREASAGTFLVGSAPAIDPRPSYLLRPPIKQTPIYGNRAAKGFAPKGDAAVGDSPPSPSTGLLSPEWKQDTGRLQVWDGNMHRRVTVIGSENAAADLLQGTVTYKLNSAASLLGYMRRHSMDDYQLSRPASQPLIILQEQNSLNNSGVPARQERAPIDDDEWEIDASEVLMGPRVGIGSFGEVYRGSWRHTDVAVKRLLEQDVQETAVEEFRREVAIMKKLRHPCIVQFLGACTKQPHLCIISAFVARGSLFRLLHRSKSPVQIDEKRRLLMALDIARGMHYLHSCRPPIVHCDLKSPNLLVDKDFTIKVADFGLSRARLSAWMASSSRTGTPEWCAPEVLRSERTNEKSDVWSFGVVLWELATGLEPWAEQSPVQVVGAVGWGGATLDIPPATNQGMADIIRSCWQAPQNRPSFEDLITSIRDLASARGFMGPPQREGSGPQLLPLGPSRQPSAEHSPTAASLALPPLERVHSRTDSAFLRRAFAGFGHQSDETSPKSPHFICSTNESPLSSLPSTCAMDVPSSGETAEITRWSPLQSVTPGKHPLRAAPASDVVDGGDATAPLMHQGSSGSHSLQDSNEHHPLKEVLQNPDSQPASNITAFLQPVRSLPAVLHHPRSLRSMIVSRPPQRGPRQPDLGHLEDTFSRATSLSTNSDPTPAFFGADTSVLDRTTSDGVPPEPSARRLAAQAARVASTKITRGLTYGLKELASGLQTAKKLVGAQVKTPSRPTPLQESMTPKSDTHTFDSGAASMGNPFAWRNLGGYRASDSSSGVEPLSRLCSSEIEQPGSSRSSASNISGAGSVGLIGGMAGGSPTVFSTLSSGSERDGSTCPLSSSTVFKIESQHDCGSPRPRSMRNPSDLPGQHLHPTSRKLADISEWSQTGG